MVTLPFWSKSTVAMSKNPFKETLSLDALVTNELLGAAPEPCGRLNSLNDDIDQLRIAFKTRTSYDGL